MTGKQTDRVEYSGTGFYVGLAAILVLALVLLIIAVQNTQDVEVAFLGVDFTVPLFSVAIGAALAAIILDELIGLVWRRRRRTRLAERAELSSLRKQASERSVDKAPDDPDPKTGFEPAMPDDTNEPNSDF